MRVVVTGMGAVSPLGGDVEALWAGMLAGRSGVRDLSLESPVLAYRKVSRDLTCRETFKRMKALGDDPHTLSAILITHEHSDHMYGLATLAKKLRIPVFMTGATYQTWQRAMRNKNGEKPKLEKFERFESGLPLEHVVDRMRGY